VLIIDAIARRDQIRILVDGLTAANQLGLTDAVPAHVVVHTDARIRPIKLGKLTISFKPTAPSRLYWAGRPSMRIVQALHWLRDLLPTDQTRMFPLSSKELAFYRFAMNGETVLNGRRTYRIAFAPVMKGHCPHIGGDESNDCEPTAWKGEAWIDAEDLQPARIITELAFRIPWGVRVFLGTNLQQTGFSISYYRAGENVWFPATYGTEFRLNVLWGYRRTIALSMESSGFQKTNASSRIEYDLPKQ
jgi:hypothetical protein